MASVRLTHDMRSSIRAALLKHRFEKDVRALIKERAAFARAVYDDIYKAKQRQIIDSLPQGWLPITGAISVKFGATYVSLEFSGGGEGGLKVRQITGEPLDSVHLPVAAKHSHGCVAVYDAGHRLSTRHEKIAAATADLKKAISEADAQISAALDATSTTAGLVKVWPEIEPVLLKLSPASVPLPAVPTAKLNEMLNLPLRKAA